MKKNKFFKILISLFLIASFSGCTGVKKPQAGFFKSINGGESFFQEETESNLALADLNILDIEINPNNNKEIFIGTSNAGLFKTVDEGKTWLADVNEFGSVYDIEMIPGTSIIYIATEKENIGKIFKSDSNGENWLEVYTEKDASSSVTSIAIDSRSPETVYFSNSKGGFFKSLDGGQTWRNLYWAEAFIRKIELDRVNPSTVYLATDKKGLVRSLDGGETFEQIIKNNFIYNVLPHPAREGFVYASTKEGLMKSLDKGGEWEAVNTLVRSEEVATEGIAINPKNPQEIYFTSGLTFYKSSNEGQTWSTKQFNASAYIEIIRINPSNPQIMYLGANRTNKSSFKLTPF
jgi:hypothetical protein